MADGSFLLVGVYAVALTRAFGSARALDYPEPAEDFLIEKLADLEVARGSSTFLAAVVLDPWACTAGVFGNWNDISISHV